MRLPAILTADLHFVADPDAEYRWGLWPWLREQAKLEKAKTICILGDLVDRKDNHPASLVNRLTDEIRKTQVETGCEINILAGNHDWLLEGQEFFRFLRHLPGVNYIAGPWEHPDVKGPLAFFLPYSKAPVEAWKDMVSFEEYDYLFMHQTVAGSVSSNGEKMPGEALPKLNARKVYSGDIHVPQVVEGPAGSIEYVGSPYHVHFGDAFVPRVVLLEAGGRAVDLHFKTISRVTVKAQSLVQLRSRVINEGDQVKVRLELRPEDRHDWSRLRREATAWVRSRGAHVHGVELVPAGGSDARVSNRAAARMSGASPAEALERFVRDEELGGHALDVGMDLL